MLTAENIAIIIPFHKDKEMLRLSLNTLERSLHSLKPQIIIVANNIDRKEIDISDEFHDYNIYTINDNLFWPGAVNYGADCTDRDFLLFCDPDLFYVDSWLERLIESYNKHDNVGLLSAKLINPLNNRIMDFGMGYNHYNTIHITKGLLYNHPATREDRRCQAACGAVLLTPHALFDKVHGIDEQMPYIYCDNDYSVKIADMGYDTWVAGQSIVYHKGNTDPNNSKYQYYRYLREDSKAAFYSKNIDKIHVDITESFDYILRWYAVNDYKFQQAYYLIDFCTLLDSAEYIKSLSSTGITIINDRKFVLPERDCQHINLCNFINTQMIYSNVPFLFFVDDFTSLYNNELFFSLRNVANDLVIDRQCNIINLYEIKSNIV